MASLQKNVASQNFTFCLVLASSGLAFVATSTTNIAGNVTKDGGAQTTVAGTIALLGLGQYNYAPTQAETNATDVGFLFSATGAIPINIDFHTDLTDATGNLQVDAVRINNVATTSVTTINANQGTTQPINFTGTGASALVQNDTRDWNGTAVSAPATAGIPDVNVKNFNNAAAGSLPTNFSSLSITAAGLVAPTSNIKKNTASSGFTFLMTDSTAHAPKTGLTVTSTVSIDGGAFAATTNSVTEVGGGTYTLNLAAADVNGNHIMLQFTATGADQLNVEIITQP